MCGAEQAGETLRRSHAQVFRDWLCLNIEQQKDDLAEYLSELPGSPTTALGAWLADASYRNLAPNSAEPVESQLYLTDLETVIELLKRERGVASPDRAR